LSLKRITGHAAALAGLKAALLGIRPGHAYLFVGPDGVGKYPTACEAAKMLVCERPQGDACEACRSCHLATRSAHPDIHLVQPAEGKRFISLEQIQELCGQYALRPHGPRRVAVIRDADRMTEEAANALLKTLEEPPDWGTLFLTSSRPSALPETILSRCQTLRFGPLSREDVMAILGKQGSVSPEDARFAAAVADGSAGQAAQFLSQGGTELRQAVLERLARLTAQDNFDMAAFARDHAAEAGAGLEDRRAALRRLFQIILRYYRDLMALQAGLPATALVNASSAPLLTQQASRLTPWAVEKAIEITLEAWERLNRNANVNLLLERYFYELGEAVAA